MNTLCNPIPGGSTHRIEWDDEAVEIHLPPVGYTIDRFPDLKTGKPSLELIKCEVINANLPLEDQRWTRSVTPKEYTQWRREELARQKTEPFYVHPIAEEFRRQEWTRKVNGCWVALGNRNKKPTDFVYLPGQAYDFFTWWKQDFGYPRLRKVLLKVFHCIQYCKDHPLINGLTLSTNRRFGKTSISMHNLWYEQSFKANRRAGMQAQTRTDASDKWEESFLVGWRNQPHFFKPKFDHTTRNKSDILFIDRGESGVAALEIAMEGVEQGWGGLNSKIDYRETHATSYDGYKLHDYDVEEPGKWVEEDVYKTIRTIMPSTMDGYKKIGFIFAPTTIEELEKGGDKFIDMFEDSRPSSIKKNSNGKTTSGLISLFISGSEGVYFDEYGNSIVKDPAKDEIVIGEDGIRLFQGAESWILKNREPYKNNYQMLTKEIRQYPLSWAEAKMMNTQDSPFNIMKLQNRLDQLKAMASNLYITGNFEWVDGIFDGDVEFVRDDLSGRWKMGKLLDIEGQNFEGDKRMSNRVGFEYIEGKKIFYPKNNRLFRIGGDPIRYDKTDNPRASKAGAYVYELFNPAIDKNVHRSKRTTGNFISEYLFRPNEFSIFGEDMIKACRYFGCSILPEENVNNLRQYFETRGYGQFVLYKGDFNNTVIKQNKSLDDAYKGLSSTDDTVSAGIQRLISLVENDCHRFIFPKQIEQMISFSMKKRTEFDAVMASIYTALAIEATVPEIVGDEYTDLSEVFPVYDVSGNRSKLHRFNDNPPTWNQ